MTDKKNNPWSVETIYNALKSNYCETQYYMRTYGLTEEQAEDCNYDDMGATIQLTYREHRQLMNKAKQYSLFHITHEYIKLCS